jgi:hypothetical protein
VHEQASLGNFRIWRQQVPKLLGSRCSAVFSVTRPIRSIAVILVQVIRDLEDSMSTMNPNGTRTWSYLSSLWSALKLNFAEWQRRTLSRRLTRTTADIEASKVFWRD